MPRKKKQLNIWNECVRMANDEKLPEYARELARIYLSQLGTAAGMTMLRDEVTTFINRHK